MSPGNLLKLTEQIYFIDAESNRWDWVVSDPGYLFCIDKMDMTRSWTDKIPVGSGPVGSASIITDSRRENNLLELQFFSPEMATKPIKEFEKTGKVKGYKFLTTDGKSYIWVSHYDVEYLLKGYHQ